MLVGWAWDMGVEAPVWGDAMVSATESRLNMDFDLNIDTGKDVTLDRAGGRNGVAWGRAVGAVGGAVGGAKAGSSEMDSLMDSSAFLSSAASSRMRPITRRTMLPMTGSCGAACTSLEPTFWMVVRS